MINLSQNFELFTSLRFINGKKKIFTKLSWLKRRRRDFEVFTVKVPPLFTPWLTQSSSHWTSGRKVIKIRRKVVVMSWKKIKPKITVLCSKHFNQYSIDHVSDRYVLCLPSRLRQRYVKCLFLVFFFSSRK